MEPTPANELLEVAARARIDEIATRRAEPDVWELGDYHRFAKATVWELGPILVEACGVGAGDAVLDVATGSGNVALRAAQLGADVVASDLAVENFEAGRREAGALGVELRWVQADAQRLPFDDDSFDVVTSSLGAMFAPDHEATARELFRVCRPGGVVGMINFTPEGLAGRFFGTLAPYLPPPPPDALPPLLWGDESHVRELFAAHADDISAVRRTYVERATSHAAYRDLFRSTFGPVVAVYARRDEEPERVDDFHRAFTRYAIEANSGSGDAAEYVYEYLLVVARKRTG